MPKLPEKVEDWQAPWEKSGEEFDAETAKTLIFNLHKSVETKDTELKTVKSEKREVETARDELQTQLEAKVSGENGEAERLSRELAAAQKWRTDREKADQTRRGLALDVALDVEGITGPQAKALAPLLRGDTEDELKASLESVVDGLGLTFGVKKDDGDGDDERDAELRRRGQRQGRTPLDPDPNADARGLPARADLVTTNELFPW